MGKNNITYEKLKRKTDELQKKLQRYEGLERELKRLNRELESAIERANRMAFENEVAYLEIQHIFESVSDAICVINFNYKIVKTNRPFLELFGVSEEEIQNKNCYEVTGLEICKTERCPLRCKTKNCDKLEFDIIKEGLHGGKRFLLLTTNRLYYPSGEPVAIIENYKDITERKKIEEKLKYLSRVDDLTGLFNRRYFMELVKREFDRFYRSNKPFSLIIADVDNFKSINDNYGHNIGDKALRIVGQIAKDTFRKTDILGRIGGEEFSFLLPETNISNARIGAERFRINISKTPVLTEKGKLFFTISLGISCMSTEIDQISTLFKYADHALYKAKRKGKNRIELYGA